MKPKKYIEAIPECPPSNHNEPPELAELMKGAREWSNYFGESLLSFCRNEAPPAFDSQIINNYFDWSVANLSYLSRQIQANINNPAYQKAYSELNFHYLNLAMIEQWRAIFGINDPPRERKGNIFFAQDYLSMLSLTTFCDKLSKCSSGKEPQYFSEENETYRKLTENRLNEFDTAIVLLEVLKKQPDLVILPSPHLFEKFAHKANSDFIVIDKNTKDILGIQAKATIHNNDWERYDKSRVIFIDGRNDLNNIMMKRTSARSSNLRSVSWNGLIAMHHLKAKKPNHIAQSNIHNIVATSTILQDMLRARSALGKTKVNIPKISSIIERRILEKLYIL